ncbi:MFS transporter [Nocardia carnea]|uniref:MFS transporter n=1 Tax=Nocardia carnea TaxID=37328 RepID=UPI002453E601|nr:MFS transporter [Nocardia carnea]
MTTSDIAEPSRETVRKASLAGFLGTAVEAYDFIVFTYIIVYLAPLFFPGDDPVTGVLNALLVLGTGFLARPIGGIVFGRIGDRRGRRFTLILTITGMGAVTALMGALPTHATVGTLAPVLLVLTRLLQGFFAGGEQIGSATFVTEHASVQNHGFLSAMTPMGFGLGTALAPGAVALTTLLTSEEAMAAWGWRIPLLLSIPLMAYTLYLRTRLEESPGFRKLADNHKVPTAPVRALLRGHARNLIKVTALSVSVLAIGYIVPAYMPLFMQQQVGMAAGITAGIATFASACSIAIGFGAGLLIDKSDRRVTMVIFLGVLAVIMFPIMYLIKATGGNIVVTALGQMLLIGFAGAAAVPVYATLTASFPAAVRYTGAAIGFGIGSALGGGLGPYLAGKFTEMTGNAYAAAGVVAVAAALGISVIMTMPGRRIAGDEERTDGSSAGETGRGDRKSDHAASEVA